MASAFISHASEDGAIAASVVRCLEAAGVSCWIAPRNVRPGGDYPSEIIRGIESSDTVVLLLSAQANASGFVSREVERAVSKGKPIFTVRIDDVLPSRGLELLVSSAHWIDAWPPPVDDHLAPLADAIRGRVPGPAVVRPTVVRPQRADRRLLTSALVLAAVLAVIGVVAIWSREGAQPSEPVSVPGSVPAAVPAAPTPSAAAPPAVAPPSAAAPPSGEPCPQKLAASVPLPLRCVCDSQIGVTSGSLWGTDVYSADSALCLAAVHAGAIPITGGVVTAVRAEPQQYLVGTSRRGVNTSDYGPYRDTFTFPGVALPSPPRCPRTLVLAATLTSPFTCQCSSEAASMGAVWGTDVYTEDSILCRAALHAGVISAAGGTVTVARAGDATSFKGTTSHGVASNDYGSFSRAIRFE